MKTSPFDSVKTFELRTDLFTKVVVEVSARGVGRPKYRIGTFRIYRGSDGIEKRTPYLGKRELRLKAGLEKAALDFVENKEREQWAKPTAKTEPAPSEGAMLDGDAAMKEAA